MGGKSSKQKINIISAKTLCETLKGKTWDDAKNLANLHGVNLYHMKYVRQRNFGSLYAYCNENNLIEYVLYLDSESSLKFYWTNSTTLFKLLSNLNGKTQQDAIEYAWERGFSLRIEQSPKIEAPLRGRRSREIRFDSGVIVIPTKIKEDDEVFVHLDQNGFVKEIK